MSQLDTQTEPVSFSADPEFVEPDPYGWIGASAGLLALLVFMMSADILFGVSLF